MAASPVFQHEARFYAGEAEFVETALRFIRDGLADRDPVMVAVSRHKIELLEAALNGDGARVVFRDMCELGANPARIIPAWQEFIDRHASPGCGIRGIGEPIWPDRTAAELVEAEIHEALLNPVFARVDGFRLLCPYDKSTLSPHTLATARRTHPFCSSHGNGVAVCHEYAASDALAWDTLPDPAANATIVRFNAARLREVRVAAALAAWYAGLVKQAVHDFVLAVSEVASNTIRHGGGAGTLRLWRESGTLCGQIDDAGRITDAMVGRVQPASHWASRRGLWIANQICDLVQIRSTSQGTTVRLHVTLA